KTRLAESSSRQAVAAVCVGVVVSVLLLDTTSEYLTMTAVTQEFWMLVGLMTGLAFAARPSAASVVELASPALSLRGATVGWRGRPVGWREPAGRRRVPPTRRRVPAVRPAPPARRVPPARRMPPLRPVPPVDWALPPA